MTQDRYCRLMESSALELTPEELAEGWHFCWDWDGLLVSPSMPMEWKHCHCLKDKERFDAQIPTH